MKNELKKLPIILGSRKLKAKISITEPTLPSLDGMKTRIKEILNSKIITNGKYVRMFEKRIENYLGVKYAIAVSSCTSGLMLLFKALGLKGEVILPSFTFSATGHAVLWNNLKPVFVDVDLDTFNIDPKSVIKAISRRTCAILGVHVFGNPARVEDLQKIAKNYKVKLFIKTWNRA